MEHLLAETGLAQPSLAGHERQDGGTRLRLVPGLPEPLPFRRAPDEGHRRVARGARPPRRLAGRDTHLAATQEPAVRIADLRAGGHAELALQRGHAAPVDALHGRLVSAEGVELHEAQVSPLLERIEAQEVLGVPHRRRVVALLLGEANGEVEGAQRRGVQPVAMGHDPLVVAVRQQVPRVGRDDPREPLARGPARAAAHRARGGELALEIDRVHVTARVVVPLHRAGIRVDPALVLRPGLAKLVQELSQVVPAVRLRCIGPEARRDLLP